MVSIPIYEGPVSTGGPLRQDAQAKFFCEGDTLFLSLECQDLLGNPYTKNTMITIEDMKMLMAKYENYRNGSWDPHIFTEGTLGYDLVAIRSREPSPSAER